MQLELSDLTFLIGLSAVVSVGIFLAILVIVAHVSEIRKDIRLARSLIAAFMEHKVAPAVAENKLAALVEEANKIGALK